MTMFAWGILVGIAITIIVSKLGPALGLWGKRQVVGKDSVDDDKV